MPKVGLENGSWVLVCDGRKALLLQNAGDRKYPKLETRKVYEHSDRPTHELGTDVPGRTFSGKDGRRAAVEPKDLQRLSEEAFLKQVANDLNAYVAGHKIEDLLLVAPARALGMLRQDISAAVRASVRAELARDYLRSPIYEIEQRLSDLLSEREG